MLNTILHIFGFRVRKITKIEIAFKDFLAICGMKDGIAPGDRITCTDSNGSELIFIIRKDNLN